MRRAGEACNPPPLGAARERRPQHRITEGQHNQHRRGDRKHFQEITKGNQRQRIIS